MTQTEVLEQLKAGTISVDEANQTIASLFQPASNLYCKVSKQGGVSVYGVNTKWPVTLYKTQWQRLVAFLPALQAFLWEHDGELSEKAPKEAATA